MRKKLRFFFKVNKVFSPARIMVLGFIAVILAGAALLSLPFSSRSGEPAAFLTALFTSASATCVTGLVVTDTARTWSMFGRIIILGLIQIGGLGFMSVMTIFFFMAKKNIGLSQRLLMAQSLSLKEMSGVVRLVRHVLIGTFVIEGVGALILWFRFAFDYGVWKGLGMGIWHSVSAFCNAGFDLMGENVPFSSLTSYAGDFIVSFTIAVLIMAGGIGFFVWEDVWKKRKFNKLHLHSKMVITVTLFLVIGGWIFFFVAERTNIHTLGSMNTPEKLLASLFQSVSPRTAGFNSIDQSQLTDASKLMTMIFMFIGGSSGSTAGGIKTVAAGVLILAAIHSLRGKSTVSAFGRTIPPRQIISALSVMIIAICLCLASSMIISLTQDIPYFDVLFETVSAMGTVGLTTGITPSLAPASQIIIMLLMFFGRVGIMTIGMAAAANRHIIEKTKYPDAWIMLG